MFKHESSTPSMRKHRQRGAVNKNAIGTLFVIFGLFIMVWALLPSSFSTDLERIGQGKPAIALIYELENGGSTSLMEGYDTIRQHYQDKVEFLVVDTASPKGEEFVRRHQATPGSAQYYDANGEKVMIIHGPQEVDALVESIKTAFDI
jgi:hypothetical protein